MAWTFGDEIKVLTGYDAMGSDDSVSGEDFYLHTNQWLKDAAKEVIHLLPPKLKQKCLTYTSLTSSTTMDLDDDGKMGDIMYVTRENADSGYQVPCREIGPQYGSLTEDESSIYYATVTDPVYWITSNASDAGTLFVKPDPSSAQEAHVYHIGYPSPTNFHNDTTIANFPDEAEYLVVLRAAVSAVQHLLAIEEDVELYAPVLTTLRTQYQEGVRALKTGNILPRQQKAR